MAKITTITNPLTGQPAQVDQLEHTAQQIDDAIARALPGGAIDTALQNKLGGIESTDYPGCYYRTVDGVAEWFNPPTFLGVEYRTTERYLGKPVYVKTVDFGAMPDNTLKVVTFGDNTTRPVSAHGIMAGEYVIPGCTGSSNYPSQEMQVFTAPGQVGITAHINRSGYTAVVIVKYWKTTD